MNDLTTPTTPSTWQPALSADGSPVRIEWIEDLFGRLTAIVGASMFTTVYAGADPAVVKAQWAEALATFTADEVRRGLAAARTRKFAPNLGEFLHLCRPALDPEIAWIEAEKGLRTHAAGEVFAWSHPAVYWAGHSMQTELRTMQFAQARKRWEVVLAEWMAVGKWPSILDPRPRRIAPPPAQAEVPGTERHAEVQAKLQAVRRKLTGFATPAEERAAAHETSGMAT